MKYANLVTRDARPAAIFDEGDGYLPKVVRPLSLASQRSLVLFHALKLRGAHSRQKRFRCGGNIRSYAECLAAFDGLASAAVDVSVRYRQRVIRTPFVGQRIVTAYAAFPSYEQRLFR